MAVPKINIISISKGQKPNDLLNSGHARIEVYANARDLSLTETWILPLPKGFNENFENNWKAVDLNPLEHAVRSGSLGGAMRGGIDYAKTKVMERVFESNPDQGKQLSASIDNVGSLVLGLSGNPYTELMYKSPKLRQLQYTWSITPISAQEGGYVKEFVANIRRYIYPELWPGGYFRYPGVFKISLIGGNGNILSNTNYASCPSFQVNYDTEGSPYIHSDGNPVTTTITMVTQEVSLLDRGEIGVLYDGNSSVSQGIWRRLT
jgi:hypothetical protein